MDLKADDAPRREHIPGAVVRDAGSLMQRAFPRPPLGEDGRIAGEAPVKGVVDIEDLDSLGSNACAHSQ